jgi:hypothetical protein
MVHATWASEGIYELPVQRTHDVVLGVEALAMHEDVVQC